MNNEVNIGLQNVWIIRNGPDYPGDTSYNSRKIGPDGRSYAKDESCIAWRDDNAWVKIARPVRVEIIILLHYLFIVSGYWK